MYIKYALIVSGAFKQKPVTRFFKALSQNTVSQVSQSFELVHVSWCLLCAEQ